MPIGQGCLGRHSLEMKLTEAWRLSKLPYREVVLQVISAGKKSDVVGRFWKKLS